LGPHPVLLGRRDGFESNTTSVNLPPPSISWQAALAFFKSKGLDVQNISTLLGIWHTMGSTHCSYILDRLYNFNKTGKPNPTMNKTLLKDLQKRCPLINKKRQSQQLMFLNPDIAKTYRLNNTYYKRVLTNKSLEVNQQLLYDSDTNDFTDQYANYFEDFRRGFGLSITRMGGIQVLTGKKGEIRRNCRVRNKS
ncbi:putative peroxidase 26, partial [Apium graveolens]|uniref:putative peroxidase 26 n=1 Tax=Apium graveolens TaxID=4045 RepID=UPI003D7BD4D6